MKAVSGAVGENHSATTGIGLDERSVGEAPVRHGGPDLRLRQVCRGWRKRRGRTVVLQGVDLDARAGTVSWIDGGFEVDARGAASVVEEDLVDLVATVDSWMAGP